METKEKKHKTKEKTRTFNDTCIETFKNRLTLLLEGRSGNAFARSVGMSEAVIRDYLSGKTYPSLSRLATIADKCDVSIEWLATGKGECRLLPETLSRGTVNVPFLNKNETINAFTILDTIPFDLTLTKHQGCEADDLAAVWAKGDCMEPTISNHDIVIINTANNKPVDGFLYTVQYDDQITIKRIQNQGSNLLLISDNPKYPTITKAKNEQKYFKIIGHVIYLLKNLN